MVIVYPLCATLGTHRSTVLASSTLQISMWTVRLKARCNLQHRTTQTQTTNKMNNKQWSPSLYFCRRSYILQKNKTAKTGCKPSNERPPLIHPTAPSVLYQVPVPSVPLKNETSTIWTGYEPSDGKGQSKEMGMHFNATFDVNQQTERSNSLSYLAVDGKLFLRDFLFPFVVSLLFVRQQLCEMSRCTIHFCSLLRPNNGVSWQQIDFPLEGSSTKWSRSTTWWL